MLFTIPAISLFVLSLSGALPTVVAHGFVSKMVIDGKSYTGNAPGATAKKSPIRQISTISPVKGAANKAVACGPAAKWAALNADAMPGSKVQFFWKSGSQNWPHNTGPMQTYMASCGNTPCSQFPALSAKWFKIQEVGRKANGQWAQADLMNGSPASVTIPKNLKAGNYLIRHEIIGLHLAEAKGGAEFYPSCAQLKVGGTQTGVPQAKDLVAFPGAYKDTDKGIVGAFFNAKAVYDFPGPNIAKLGTSTSSKRSTDSEDTNGVAADVTTDVAEEPVPRSWSSRAVKAAAIDEVLPSIEHATDATPLPVELPIDTPTLGSLAARHNAKRFNRAL